MRPTSATLAALAAGLFALLSTSEAHAVCCGATCCFIDGMCRTTGQDHPTDPCLECDPTMSQSAWSTVASCVDGGPPGPDAGASDAGASDSDGGAGGTDAGSTGTDAGTSGTDSGTPRMDSGTPGTDAGGPTPPPASSGCSCRVGTRAGSAAPLLGLGLVVAALRRR